MHGFDANELNAVLWKTADQLAQQLLCVAHKEVVVAKAEVHADEMHAWNGALCVAELLQHAVSQWTAVVKNGQAKAFWPRVLVHARC